MMRKQVSPQPKATKTVNAVQPAGELSAGQPKNILTTMMKKTNSVEVEKGHAGVRQP